jgi:outer membrane protein OmpA-like peptidoglycan-associated protein
VVNDWRREPAGTERLHTRAGQTPTQAPAGAVALQRQAGPAALALVLQRQHVEVRRLVRAGQPLAGARAACGPMMSAPHGGMLGSGLLELQARAGNRAVGELLNGHATLQRTHAGGTAEPDVPVQRSLFDDISGAVSGLAGAVTGLVKAAGDVISTGASAAGAGLSIMSAPACTKPGDKPAQGDWLEDPGLESIRHDGKLLSQGSAPAGNKGTTTRLVKQFLMAWGCEKHGRNMLAKHGVNTVYGNETATAVKAFQLLSLTSPDGKVGPVTLEAMDKQMGVARVEPPDPAEVGGDESTGASRFIPGGGFRKLAAGATVGRIYFPTDGTELDSLASTALTALAGAAEDTVTLRLRVEGFADKREHEAHNVTLSLLRAAIVADRLSTASAGGAFALDISFEGRGEIERPQPGSTAEDLKHFRRADVTVESVDYPDDPQVANCDAPPATVDIYVVSLPGASGAASTDVREANAIWAQCNLTVNLAGAETWETNLLDRGVLKGVLETPGYPGSRSPEEAEMLAHRPGGPGTVHVYYVPEIRPATHAQSYWPSKHGLRALVIEDTTVPTVLAHELWHVLADDGDHDDDTDNLMHVKAATHKGRRLRCDQCP